MKIEEKLSNLNLKIPEAPNPVGAYVACKKISNLLFISGQISIDAYGKITKGKLGKELSLSEGQAAAKLCAINIIAQAKKACNEKLEDIKNLNIFILYFSFFYHILFFFQLKLEHPP